MDWQEIATFFVVGIAFVAVGVKFFSRKKLGGLKDCCSSGGKSQSIVFTIKKGDKPKIILKSNTPR